MKNLTANTPGVVVAKVDISFADAGITADNIRIIYLVGNPLLSYMPDRDINAVTNFVLDSGYYIVPKQDMDLSAYVLPVAVMDLFEKWHNGTLVLGDSITAGVGVAGGQDWAHQIATALGITINNTAISGIASRQAIKIFMDNQTIFPTVPLSAMFGFNGNRQPDGLPDYTPYQNIMTAAHRAMCAIQFAKQMIFPFEGSDGHAAMAMSNGGGAPGTLSTMQDWGSRIPYHRIHDGANSAANWFNKVATAGDTLTFSFTGTAIAIGTYGCDGSVTNLARIKVTIDGVDKVTYNPAGMTYAGNNEIYTQDGVINDAIFVSGLTDASHTVVLTILDSRMAVIDWAAVLKTPTEAATSAIYVLDLPHMAAAGYAYGGGPTSQAVLDAATLYRNNALRAVLPDHPIAYVDINAAGYYEPFTNPSQIQGDGIHPTALGQTKIKDRVMFYFQP